MIIRFREPNELDLPLISRWIDQDLCPQHNDVKPEWWMDNTEGTKCFVVENENGVVFYLKLETMTRCYIQFPPDAERDKAATAIALKKAFLEISGGLKNIGHREMIFDSKSEGLINLFAKFGFKETKDNFLVRL
jgi:hypothetical protein